jgi:hypothetical protein
MQLWQPQSCSKIRETGEMKDIQQISQYSPYVKNATNSKKTLTQTKTLTSHGDFLRIRLILTINLVQYVTKYVYRI